jgi:hypothetical protein
MAEHELAAGCSIASTPFPLPHPTSTSNPNQQQLEFLLDFLARALRAVNEFIERTASGGPDVTLGPRILLQTPLDDVDKARQWFTQLWNEKLAPYMRRVAAVEGQLTVTKKCYKNIFFEF